MLILVKVLQKNRTNSMCECVWGGMCMSEKEKFISRERKREIYFKELSHMIVDASKSKTGRVDQH